MAEIIQFPHAHPGVRAAPSFVCFEQQRAQLQSAEEVARHCLTEAAFAPFYGIADPDSNLIPFFAYAELNSTGRASSLALPPHKTQYYLAHPRDAQDLLWGAQLSACVITEAHWSGGEKNLPWRGLVDPVGYVRSSIRDICMQLREGGCDTRIVENLPITLHSRPFAAAAHQNQLALCFTARRRIELVRSAAR